MQEGMSSCGEIHLHNLRVSKLRATQETDIGSPWDIYSEGAFWDTSHAMDKMSEHASGADPVQPLH